MRRARLFAVAAAAALCSAGAKALDLHLGAAYEYQYSDNVRLSAVSPQVESAQIGRVVIDVTENSPQLMLHSAANLEYRDYANDVFADGVYGSANLAALWTVTPQRLKWSVEDYFSQTVINTLASDTPNNRQDTNVFATGPDFLFRINALNNLEISARYSNYYYEVTDSNNNRAQGDLRWVYRLTGHSDVSLNYQTLVVHYGNDVLNPNFVRDEAFVRARTRPARSEFTFDLGASTIAAIGADRSAGALARLRWRRELNPHANLVLLAATEYSDRDRDLQGEAGIGGGGSTGNAVGIGGYYYSKRFNATYTAAGSYSTKNLHLYWRDVDYESGLSDQAVSGAETELGFDSGPLFTPAIFGGYQETRYDQNGIIDDDQYAGARLRYRLRPRLAITLEGRESRRSSSDEARAYDETRALLTLSYNRHSFAAR